ncbi:MAG: serine hydrolase [Bacteroidia bacterium]|nr:serine hydrolase [Bacteroidia bacterium]
MKYSLLSIYIALAFTCKAQTGLYIPQLAAFDNAMLNLISTYNVPGAQLAITYHGRLVYNRGFGFANTATLDSVYPSSIFRVASISKTITAVACMRLFENGLLQLDAKVFGKNGILNDSIYQDILDKRDTNITVRMLLQHTGGWNRDISGDIMFNSYNIATTLGLPSLPSTSDVIRYALKYKNLDFTPGSQYQYSNFGFCVLGRIIEKITGQTYESYIRNNIFIPLGISSTKLGYNLYVNQLPNEVNYYDYPGAPLANSVYDNKTKVPWPYGGFNIEFMDSHGGWVTSGEDLLKFVCAFDRYNTRPDILSIATIDTLTKPSLKNSGYACGIQVNTYNNWWHTGALPGTTTEFVRDGNGQLNWSILLNSRNSSGDIITAVDQLVWNVLPSISESSWPSHDLFNNSTPTITTEHHSATKIIEIYPNPTREKIYFSEYTNVKMLDVTNQIIFNGKNINTLDLTEQAAGIYYVILTDDKGLLLQQNKIVKYQ